jgi:hypothetical protein
VFEIEISTKSSVKKALRYPIIVMSVVVVAGFIAMTQVIPAFSGIFASSGAELPTLTRLLMATSGFLSDYALIIIVVFAGVVFGIKSYVRTPVGAFQWDSLKLKLPIVKGVIITSSMARFSLIMKTLLASGVQIVDALDIAKRTVGNLVYEKEIGRAKDLIVGGVPISEALESEYIPDITNNMIAIGEETGSVTTMLGTVSDYYMVVTEPVSSPMAIMLFVMSGIYSLSSASLMGTPPTIRSLALPISFSYTRFPTVLFAISRASTICTPLARRVFMIREKRAMDEVIMTPLTMGSFSFKLSH